MPAFFRTTIGRRERRRRKGRLWILEMAEENAAEQRAMRKAAKDLQRELGAATFVQCAFWVRFGE